MPKKWWQGDQGAVDMGYGTFESRPAAPEPVAPVLDALIEDDAPVVDQQQQQYADQMQRLQMSLVDMQLQLSRQVPGSIRYNGKLDQVRSIQAKIQKLQIQGGS
jgi:hypothetical protein